MESHFAPKFLKQHSEKTLVFYDGKCSLCSREIAHYRNCKGGDSIQWKDIAQEPNILAEFGIDRSTAMARFHVLTSDGIWHTGALGFAELWSHLPAYRWLANTLRILHLLPLLDYAYFWFSRLRLKHRCKNGTCDIASLGKE